LLISVGCNGACIDRKAFTTNKTARNAGFNDPLEQKAEDVTLAKTLIPGGPKIPLVFPRDP
jgi:hypothetical protein